MSIMAFSVNKGSIKNVGTKSSANNRTAAAMNQICVIMTI